MPICPTCGKKIAMSWQMEKHQKSSRCKLAVKTKEFNRVSEDLRIMCGNVEKLQAALIALEKEKQLPPSDTESRKNMEQIMNKLQEIWDFIKHEIHSSEPRSPLLDIFPSTSSTCSTERSPILSTIKTITSENGNKNDSSINANIDATNRIFLMRNELKEYLKNARPSVVKLAESHQVPHLIDLFSRFERNEKTDNVHLENKSTSRVSQQEIVPILVTGENSQECKTTNTPQISSETNQVPETKNNETMSTNISNTRQTEITSEDKVSSIRDKFPIIQQPVNGNITMHNSDVNIDHDIIPYTSHPLIDNSRTSKVLIQDIKQHDSAEIETTNSSCDIGTQTITINKQRKPHSAKALGNNRKL